MPTYDRRLESQDQPQTKPLDRSHPFYGPDPVQMREQYRDQTNPGEGFWRRIWRSILGA